MKKKIVIGIATFVALVGIAFCASCYKYTFNVHVKCNKCNGYQDISIEADNSVDASSRAKSCFYNHKDGCTGSFANLNATVMSKHTNDYAVCD